MSIRLPGPILSNLLLPLLLILSTSLLPALADEDLIGWKGEVQRQAAEERSAETSSSWIETISWEPRAFIYHGFLSKEECLHMRAVAESRLSRSMVVDEEGKDAVDSIRTSFSAGLQYHETDVIADIERRIAMWTHLPEENGEPLEVLRYRNNQKYEAHWDYFGNDTGPAGDRIATVLMYLASVDKDAGGETSLPLAVPLSPLQTAATEEMSPCAKRMGFGVQPRMGDALLFWNAHPDPSEPDRHALHSSCPTFKGDKWTATKWIHKGSLSG